MSPHPAVPPMRTQVPGRRWGGAYETSEDFDFTATVTPEGVRVALLGPTGECLHEQVLTPVMTRQVLTALSGPEPVDLVPGVVGLTRQVRWVMGSDEAYADLTPDLEELTAWLRYAVGDLTWDEDPEVDWEF